VPSSSVRSRGSLSPARAIPRATTSPSLSCKRWVNPLTPKIFASPATSPPGTIERSGPNATFTLIEQGKTLRVNYIGAEPPPDTFKDDAQALAIGTYGRDGTFHATQLQAKCASKYAPAQPGATTPTGNTAAPRT